MKRALITGITGQDGAYLAAHLLGNDYQVFGIARPSSAVLPERIQSLLSYSSFKIYYSDMTDPLRLVHLICDIKPDEIYNLAAQSHVGTSFNVPVYTAQVDALGILHLLEAVRIAGLIHSTKIYQASTSELFGKVSEIPQTETTPFHPRSAYAVAKLYAYWIVKNYRESYGMFACNGILFNHESPYRGHEFVTRKITRGVAHYILSSKRPLSLGNLNAQRDWGHARDYVRAMVLMMQYRQPDDFVIATGKTYSVRECVERAFAVVGIPVIWSGSGLNEKGINALTGDVCVVIDPQFFRPCEVDLLCGDATKARTLLGWQPHISFEEMITEMVVHDCNELRKKNNEYSDQHKDSYDNKCSNEFDFFDGGL